MDVIDQQLSGYGSEGFCVVEHLVSEAELAELRQRTEDIAEGKIDTFPRCNIELEPGATSCSLQTARKLNRCAESDEVLLAHARHPSVLDIVERLIGSDIKLFGSQCFMKPPGGVEKPYHQDSAYFAIEPMELVTCWTALDDVTLENGCMWVVAGSHQQGVLDHSEPWLVGDRQDMRVPQAMIDQSREQAITMPAGSCSFHHSLLLHRSTANGTERPRRGLAIHYMSSRSRWTDPSRPQPDYLLLRGAEFPDCV